MKVLHSFKYAFAGLKAGLSETNMQIHWLVTVAVIGLGIFLHVSWFEWALLSLCIGSVIAAELFNTVIEDLGDVLTEYAPKLYPKMGKPKDVAAAAVLTLAITAAFVGCFIFIPRLMLLLQVG